jgi:hypothetical protein
MGEDEKKQLWEIIPFESKSKILKLLVDEYVSERLKTTEN